MSDLPEVTRYIFLEKWLEPQVSLYYSVAPMDMVHCWTDNQTTLTGSFKLHVLSVTSFTSKCRHRDF